MRPFFMIIFITTAIILESILNKPHLAFGKEDKYIPVLMYHTFDNTPSFPYINTSPAHFEEQMTTLKQAGYSTITIGDLLDYLQGEDHLPTKPILITIDDGYRSIYTNAYPIIKKYKLFVCLFISTSYVQKGQRLGRPFLNWTQIRKMYHSGLVEVQNHTHDLHWRYNNKAGKEALITPTSKDGEHLTHKKHHRIVKRDINKAKQMIEKNVGNSVFAFAYPYGAYNKDIENIVSQQHQLIFTTTTGINTFGTNRLEIKRININDSLKGKQIIKEIKALENYSDVLFFGTNGF
ncbi:peptidoglycan/xylan/chitin deacetylase (PgdA/CDA1 family) [Pullulanibacillus pueri]|uniref:NodB homology domain-containing protein n=1 Tax=Pullulanibacillus pueri TaxID=1437324 RepID=A0A8J2ZWP4_9BACL|nr:polysaccharide deacetylase family protein [Pullulanibacillus pueri]MBM7682379.1 peptidoglycan/xylan/chitin deacetylase (PgdA/CDA1 family) [Pullulanibacillus pueri]GGH81869.1 hypothetical protein GCM10007096_20410 [Pullulanibacillus pueri]